MLRMKGCYPLSYCAVLQAPINVVQQEPEPEPDIMKPYTVQPYSAYDPRQNPSYTGEAQHHYPQPGVYPSMGNDVRQQQAQYGYAGSQYYGQSYPESSYFQANN